MIIISQNFFLVLVRKNANFDMPDKSLHITLEH